MPRLRRRDFREEKSIEVGNIFKLMNKFTKPFDFSVNDEKGEKREVIVWVAMASDWED